MGQPNIDGIDSVTKQVFGSMYIAYDIEFKEILIKEKDSFEDIAIYQNNLTPIGADIKFTAPNSKLDEENAEIADDEVDEFLVTFQGNSTLSSIGCGEGEVLYGDKEVRYEPFSPGSDPEKAVIASLVIPLFVTLADLFIGKLMQNLSGDTISWSTPDNPIMQAKKIRINPNRLVREMENVIRAGLKPRPKYKAIESQAIMNLQKTEPQVVENYMAKHYPKPQSRYLDASMLEGHLNK